MKKNVKNKSIAAKRESGYALLIVVFLTALVLVGSMEVGLRVATEGRRQKEQEMIWRGKQYTRGVKLYYRKFGRFPTSLDALTKPSTGNIRFLRQEYKDPMNKEDGAWRLIYVGPAGQLIGSLKPQPGNLRLPQAGGQAGTATGAFGTGTPAAGGATQGATTGTAGATTGTAGTVTTGTGTGAQGTDTAGAGADQNIPTGDTPVIMGGNIIGVGSKTNQRSVIIYEKASNYRLFEFIWDPSKDLGIVGSQSVGPGGQSPSNPTGTQPGTGTGATPGQGNPPQTPQQPPLSNPQ